MAVLAGIYGQKSESYVGCTLDTYEHNGYHDSYFYAVCWDDENGKIVEIEYDTTASGGGGYAKDRRHRRCPQKSLQILCQCWTVDF